MPSQRGWEAWTRRGKETITRVGVEEEESVLVDSKRQTSQKVKKNLDEKARFARVCTARRWSLGYKVSSIDLLHQSPTLDPALEANGARRMEAIRLINDSQ